MNYCGIDVSKKSSHYCIMNAERSVVARGKVGNHRVDLKREFGPMAPMKIVLEACGIGFWMADQLEELGHAVTVVDPGKTKAIGSSRIKNDKLDARVLATLCQADLVAPVDRPSQAERYARMPAVTRDALVKARTALINTVRGMLHSEGVLAPSCGTAAFTETIRALPEGLDGVEVSDPRTTHLTCRDGRRRLVAEGSTVSDPEGSRRIFLTLAWPARDWDTSGGRHRAPSADVGTFRGKG
jgi:transposase